MIDFGLLEQNHLVTYMTDSTLISLYAIPVSYTHLDVYKRQQLYRGGFNRRNFGIKQRFLVHLLHLL